MTESKKDNRLTQFIPFFAALFAVLLYSASFSHQFVLNDLEVIEGKSSEHSALVQAFFSLESSFFGDTNPEAMHSVSVLLYALISFFLYKLLRLWSLQERTAFAATLLFVSHPIHSEVIAHIAYQEYLLAGLFLLLCLNFWEKALVLFSVKWGLLSSVFLCLALFSNAAALVLLPTMILRYLMLKNFAFDRKYIACAAIPFIIYIIYIFQLDIPKTKVLENALSYQNSALDQLAMSFEFFLNYLVKFFWPQDLVYTYEFNTFNLHSWGNWKSVLGLLLFIGLLFSAVLAWKKSKSISLSLAFILFALLPFLQIFKLIEGSFAERYLFIASIGFTFLLGQLAQKQKYLVYLLFAISILFSWKTYARLPDWKNEQSILEADIKKANKSLEANRRLAIFYYNKSQESNDEQRQKYFVENASPLFEKAINIYGNDKLTWFYFGMNHLMTGEYTMSELAFKEVLRLDPNYTAAYNNLGNIYYLRSERPEAKAQYELAVKSDPQNAEALSNLGAMYLLIQQYDSAYLYLEQASRLEPNNENTLYNFNLVKKKMGY